MFKKAEAQGKASDLPIWGGVGVKVSGVSLTA